MRRHPPRRKAVMVRRNILVTAACLVGVLAITPAASAQVTDFRAVQVDNSDGGPALDGFVTNSLRVDYDGVFTRAQLLLNLDTGSIYRDTQGNPNGTPRNPFFFGMFPSLKFDSYLGNLSSSGVSAGAGAVNLGGDPARAWPNSTIAAPTTLNQAWNPVGTDIDDRNDYETFRLTFSQDAAGTFGFLVEANRQFFRSEGVIRDGVVTVPEPAAAMAMALGLAGLALTNRCRYLARPAASGGIVLRMASRVEPGAIDTQSLRVASDRERSGGGFSLTGGW